MKTSVIRALLVMTLGSSGLASSYGQGAGMVDVQLPEPDKYDLEKVINSPGEADSKYIYKITTHTKDSLSSNGTPGSGNTGNNAAVSVSKIRPEKATTPSTKETVIKQSKNQEEPSAKSKNQDDSILSFNFLYYIIEKYKLQDIVD
jgi:hypothetical protein